MSIWADIHKRSNGATIRKEDVDAKIAEALSEVKFKFSWSEDKIILEVKSEDKIILEVKSEDKGGWVYTNYVLCRVATLLSLQTHELRITLNTNENVKAIKDAIGDKKIKSILPSTIIK